MRRRGILSDKWRAGWLGLVAGYGAWRLAELVLSKRHERDLEARGIPRREEAGFGWMVAAHAVPFTLAPVEALHWNRKPPRALAIGSLAALAGAAALRFWVLKTLGPRWNVHVHASETLDVTDRGPYRWVRHPNYAAVIVELAALPLAGGAYVSAVVASALDAIALARRIPVEERALSESMAWRVLMRHKPRFLPLLPSLRPHWRGPLLARVRHPRPAS